MGILLRNTDRDARFERLRNRLDELLEEGHQGREMVREKLDDFKRVQEDLHGEGSQDHG